jgi:hypothetical protein
MKWIESKEATMALLNERKSPYVKLYQQMLDCETIEPDCTFDEFVEDEKFLSEFDAENINV